jgi:hypothetical protein
LATLGRTGSEQAAATLQPGLADAHRLANGTIRGQTIQDGTDRDRYTTRLLLRHTRAPSQLRGEKGWERLKGLMPDPSRSLPVLVNGDG